MQGQIRRCIITIQFTDVDRKYLSQHQKEGGIAISQRYVAMIMALLL